MQQCSRGATLWPGYYAWSGSIASARVPQLGCERVSFSRDGLQLRKNLKGCLPIEAAWRTGRKHCHGPAQ